MEKIEQLRQRGKSVDSIAKLCRVSRDTLLKVVDGKAVTRRRARLVAFGLNVSAQAIRVIGGWPDNEPFELIKCRIMERQLEHYGDLRVRQFVRRVADYGKTAKIDD